MCRVRLIADETGIYAIRHCRNKVFFWSTDYGNMEMTDGELLPRDQKQLIFNYLEFKDKLKRYLQAKKGENVPVPWYPAVVLTVAHKWNIRFPLNSVLVFGIVDPLRATATLDGAFATWEIKPKPKNVHLGLHHSLLEMPSLE